MKTLIAEFRDFIDRGNLLDLAIAVVLATFFAPVITAIVDGVLMNLIAAVFGQPNFDSITIDVGDARLLIGSVITALVQFVAVAFACFAIVKAYNAAQRAGSPGAASEEAEEDAGPTEVELLIEIRDQLRSTGG